MFTDSRMLSEKAALCRGLTAYPCSETLLYFLVLNVWNIRRWRKPQKLSTPERLSTNIATTDHIPKAIYFRT